MFSMRFCAENAIVYLPSAGNRLLMRGILSTPTTMHLPLLPSFIMVTTTKEATNNKLIR